MKEKTCLDKENDSEDDLWDYKPVKRVRKSVQSKNQNPKTSQLSTIIPHPKTGKDKASKKQGKKDKEPPTKGTKSTAKKTAPKPKESVKPPSQCYQSSSELFTNDHSSRARLVNKESFPSEKEGGSVVKPTKRLSDGLPKEGCQSKEAKTEPSQSSQNQKKIAKGQQRQSAQKKSKTPQRTPTEV